MQGDVYLPGSVGTQLAHQPSHTRADPQACREKGRTTMECRAKARTSVAACSGCDRVEPRAPAKSILQDWGILFYFLSPARAT